VIVTLVAILCKELIVCIFFMLVECLGSRSLGHVYNFLGLVVHHIILSHASLTIFGTFHQATSSSDFTIGLLMKVSIFLERLRGVKIQFNHKGCLGRTHLLKEIISLLLFLCLRLLAGGCLTLLRLAESMATASSMVRHRRESNRLKLARFSLV